MTPRLHQAREPSACVREAARPCAALGPQTASPDPGSGARGADHSRLLSRRRAALRARGERGRPLSVSPAPRQPKFRLSHGAPWRARQGRGRLRGEQGGQPAGCGPSHVLGEAGRDRFRRRLPALFCGPPSAQLLCRHWTAAAPESAVWGGARPFKSRGSASRPPPPPPAP